MRVTLAQIDSTDEIDLNLGLIGRAVNSAGVNGSSVVVFPEYAMYEKKAVDETFAAAAQPIDGEFGSALSELADQRGITLVVGMVERNLDDAARPFNTVAVFGPDGSLVGQYRKIHLYDSATIQESAWITASPDARPVVLDIGGTRLGLMTCNDLRFPDLGEALAADGAHLVAVCASWVPGPNKIEQWKVLAQARAIENNYVVVAVSQASPVSIGNSMVALPTGEIRLRLGETPMIATVDLRDWVS